MLEFEGRQWSRLCTVSGEKSAHCRKRVLGIAETRISQGNCHISDGPSVHRIAEVDQSRDVMGVGVHDDVGVVAITYENFSKSSCSN
jgi:hypothetical protein